jgi:hypothetical protein
VTGPIEHGRGGGRAGRAQAWRPAFWWCAGVAAVGLSRVGLATEPRHRPGWEGAGGDVAAGVLVAHRRSGSATCGWFLLEDRRLAHALFPFHPFPN